MSTRPERPLHGPLRSFDLEAEVSRLQEEWQAGRRNAVTLRKGGGLNVPLLAMKAGDRLGEHSAPGPTTAEGSVEAGPEALGDAVCLINLAKSG